MSWIKVTRREVGAGDNEEVTINTDKIAYYTKNITEHFKGQGSVVVLQSNYAIIVTDTVAEIDDKIGVNPANLPQANVFDPCI